MCAAALKQIPDFLPSWKKTITNLFSKGEKNHDFSEIMPFLQTLWGQNYASSRCHLFLFLPHLKPQKIYSDFVKSLQPRDVGYLQELFGQSQKTGNSFHTYFTLPAPPPADNIKIGLYGFSVGQAYLLLHYPIKNHHHFYPQEQKMAGLAEDLFPVPMWCRDKMQKIIWANIAYQKKISTPQAKETQEIFPKQKVYFLAQSALNSNETHHLILSHASQGTHFDYQVYEIPYALESGEQGTIGYALDVTEHIKLQKEMTLQKKALRIFYRIFIYPLFSAMRRGKLFITIHNFYIYGA